MGDHNNEIGTPAICKLEGQVMAHRQTIVALGILLKCSEVFDQSIVKLLDQHLASQSNAVLDIIRDFPDGSKAAHDGLHVAAGFEQEIQDIIDAIGS